GVVSSFGSSSASADLLWFNGSNLLPGQPALLFVGENAVNNGNGALFGDGLLGRLAGGERALFVHGDELCTRDRAYQRYKRIVRTRPVRSLAAVLPTSLGRALGRRLRRASRKAVAAKAPAYKALQPAAARDLAAAAGASTLVCGHAHAARDERIAGGPRWIVLDAYGGERDQLSIDGGGRLELVSSSGRA
ncbi:MAG: hypothetical protein QF410_04890, partial [Planctomycetota bacterium]|nr:hypothetical protein [Planctomycetota bacterium]